MIVNKENYSIPTVDITDRLFGVVKFKKIKTPIYWLNVK